MQFCTDCRWLMYPRHVANDLYFHCDQCQTSVLALQSTVFETTPTTNNVARLLSHDVASDPTLPRILMATPCGHTEAAYVSSASETANAIVHYCVEPGCGRRF